MQQVTKPTLLQLFASIWHITVIPTDNKLFGGIEIVEDEIKIGRDARRNI